MNKQDTLSVAPASLDNLQWQSTGTDDYARLRCWDGSSGEQQDDNQQYKSGYAASHCSAYTLHFLDRQTQTRRGYIFFQVDE